MISYIKGTLAAVDGSKVIVEADTFGIAVKTSRTVIERLPTKGAELLPHTYLKVNEGAASLYGPDEEADLRFFRVLFGTSDVRPKRALAALSALKPETLKLAVLTSDAKAIIKAPDIGVRIAERIIPEPKNQGVMQVLSADTMSGGNASDTAAAEAADVLVQLGCGIGEATRAVRTVPEAEERSSGTLLRETLRQF